MLLGSTEIFKVSTHLDLLYYLATYETLFQIIHWMTMLSERLILCPKTGAWQGVAWRITVFTKGLHKFKSFQLTCLYHGNSRND